MNVEDSIKKRPLSWAFGVAISSATLMFGFMQYINVSNNDALQNQINHLSMLKEELENRLKNLDNSNKSLIDKLNNKSILNDVSRNYESLKSEYEKLKNEAPKLIKNKPSKNDSILRRIQELEKQKKKCEIIWVYPPDLEREKRDFCIQYNLELDKRIDDFYKLLQ